MANAPASPKVAIYARVSTDDQDCALQLAELRGYTKRRGWKKAVEFVDTGWSGAKRSRPELDKLMKAGRAREIDVVLVWKLDRFGRSVKNLTDQLGELDAAGVRFIAVTQGLDTDQSNPASRLLLHVLAAVAEFEREQIRERVKAGMLIAKSRGTKSGNKIGRPSAIFRRDKVLEMRREGKSLRTIARELSISLGAVQRTIAS